MSDAKLKKKVQLKQKTETPVVQLKRKGEAAEAVHLKKKTDPGAASAAAAAAATAATAAAATAAAAEKGATAEAASAAEAKKAGAVQGQGKQAGTGAASTASTVNGKTGTTGSSSTGTKPATGNGSTGSSSEKGKGGKVLGWILGAAAVAGLAFGGYKLVDNNKGDKSPLADGETVVGSAEAGNSAADEGAATAQDSQSAAENAANGANGSAKNAGGNANASVGQGNAAAGKTSATTSTASSNGSATTATVAAGTSEANGSSATASEANGVNAAPAFTVNKVSDAKAECLFEFDSSVVAENPTLNEIAEAARKSGKTVTISGYTDKVGTDEYNQWLSDRRANAIRAYLVKRGVSSDKINATGYGVCKTYSTNAENRRADITLE